MDPGSQPSDPQMLSKQNFHTDVQSDVFSHTCPKCRRCDVFNRQINHRVLVLDLEFRLRAYKPEELTRQRNKLAMKRLRINLEVFTKRM